MNEKSTPWSEITSGILAVLTAITTYLGTQPFNTLFAVLLGAAVTYSVQKRLQTQSEKRSKNAEYVEKYYGPLLAEIEGIQETVLNDVSENYDFPRLKKFQTYPQFYTMGKKLKEDFLTFSDEMMKFIEKISYYRRRTKELIRRMTNPYLIIPPGKLVELNPDSSNAPIYFRYYHESDRFIVTLDDCILRGKSPIEIVKDKVTNFREENLEVEFYLFVRDIEKGGSCTGQDIKSFPERKQIMEEIVSKVNAELDKDVGYKNFKSELAELRKKATSLSRRLTKYVEEYVSIVDI